MVKVTTTSEVELTPDLMARAFANMGSDQQAMFLSSCWHELLEACEGVTGASMQMAAVRAEQTFDSDAARLVEELTEPTEGDGRTYYTIDVQQRDRYDYDAVDYSVLMQGYRSEAGGMRKLPGEAVAITKQISHYAMHTARDEYAMRRFVLEDMASQLGRAMIEKATATPKPAMHPSTERLRAAYAAGEVEFVGAGASRLLPGDDYVMNGAVIGKVLDIENEFSADTGCTSHRVKVAVSMPFDSTIIDDPQGHTIPAGTPVYLDPNNEIVPDYVGGMVGAGTYLDPPKTPPPPVCDECKGTGYWENPAGGRNHKTPCSKGCKPKD